MSVREIRDAGLSPDQQLPGLHREHVSGYLDSQRPGVHRHRASPDSLSPKHLRPEPRRRLQVALKGQGPSPHHPTVQPRDDHDAAGRRRAFL